MAQFSPSFPHTDDIFEVEKIIGCEMVRIFITCVGFWILEYFDLNLKAE